MNLFGDLDPDTLGSPSTIAASSQAAWGLFNFLVYAKARSPSSLSAGVDSCVQTNGSVSSLAASPTSTYRTAA